MLHEASTKHDHWLEWFLDKPDEDHPSRFEAPFPFGDGWTGATYVNIAVITKEPCPSKPAENTTKNKKVLAFLEKMANENYQKTSVSYADMVEKIGPCEHPAMDKCGECGGKGTVFHHCNCDLCEEDEQDCPECDGKGQSLSYDERQGKILGWLVDLNLIAYVLEHCPVQKFYGLSLVNSSAKDSKDQILRIDTEGWIALIAGLRKSKASVKVIEFGLTTSAG